MLKENKLSQNILMYKLEDYNYEDTRRLHKIDINSFMISVIINGNSSYESLINDYKTNVKTGHTLIDIVNKNNDSIVKTSKNTNNQSIGIIIPKDFLEIFLANNKMKDDFLNFLETGKGIKNISNKKTNPITKSLAWEMFNNPYTNNLEKLYTESKVLELIYTEFTNLFQQNDIKPDKSMKFTSQDKEAIYHARDILMNNLQNPPSMKELARKIAVNDLKLKIGFHKYFNNTPYNIYCEYRLQEAKRLLQNSDLNINEISVQIGYKYAQNFSNAFFKRFGIRPKDLMKNRKY